MNVGIVGFGLMGEQRAMDVRKIPTLSLVAISDINTDKLKKYQQQFGFQIEKDWRTLISRKDIDLVVISVPHFLAAEIAIASLQAGKHVLCEKPLGMDTVQARTILDAACNAGKLVEPGFNYRFYPGVQKAKKLMENGEIGKITHVRIAFGHGGRRGMEKEWKIKKEFAGGGAFLDPGIHAIDLTRFLFGELRWGMLEKKNSFWKADVEDDAMAIMETEKDVLVSMHVSIGEWKSLFRMEIFGDDGYIFLTGRSKSYGPQKVVIGKRWFFENNIPETVWNYSAEDISFLDEMKQFIAAIEGREFHSLATGEDGARAVEVIMNLYNKPATRINLIHD